MDLRINHLVSGGERLCNRIAAVIRIEPVHAVAGGRQWICQRDASLGIFVQLRQFRAGENIDFCARARRPGFKEQLAEVLCFAECACCKQEQHDRTESKLLRPMRLSVFIARHGNYLVLRIARSISVVFSNVVSRWPLGHGRRPDARPLTRHGSQIGHILIERS